jgi:hypothetical protein
MREFLTITVQVSHHNNVIHDHPSSPTIPKDSSKMDAQQCPALKNIKTDVVEATCPVVNISVRDMERCKH